jgi:hypothetical protein
MKESIIIDAIGRSNPVKSYEEDIENIKIMKQVEKLYSD